MNDPAMFERLFRWDAWANARVIAALRGVEASGQRVPPKAVDRLAHVVRAGEIWLSRLGYGEREDGRALFPESASLKETARDADLLAARWAQYARILSPAALEETVAYTSTEGAAFGTAVRDILLHVTHHAAYHRGQIAVDLKQAGVRLPEGVSLPTDYIFFARSEAV